MYNQDSNNISQTKPYQLGFDLCWENLHQHDTLVRLDKIFYEYLQSNNEELANRLVEYRNSKKIDDTEFSTFLIEIAEIVEAFLAELFLLPELLNNANHKAKQFTLLYKFKRNFIQRRALTKYPTLKNIDSYNIDDIYSNIQKDIGQPYTHINFAQNVMKWLENPNHFSKQLHNAEIWGAYNALQINTNSIFAPLEKINYHNTETTLHHQPQTNLGFDFKSIHDENHGELQAHYCLSCHKQGKDSCRIGLKDKETQQYTQNDLGNILQGCPLDQKISEMITTARVGHKITSLAIAMIDNPMIAITGHRICNDCAKSCIFQKQSHVDVPAIESEIFNHVINLPMGIEIYNLLLLWNPLNVSSPLPAPPTGKRVMIAGLGPSGFSMAYYMLRLGHTAIAIDGLKIEPTDLPINTPIISWKDVAKPLTQLSSDGFGGVAQYGITSRWDKNNLRIIRLILERFDQFEMHGSTMLGKSFSAQEAFEEMGINHLCLAFGAGSPNIPKIPNILSKRIWPAADFLMNINLQKPYLKNSLANMQIRLPLIVFGAGLTAIDSAVESVKYYIELVEKFSNQYHSLDNPETFLSSLSLEDQEIANEYLQHAKLLKQSANKIKTINELGGIHILYRNSLNQAPSYRLNHEEVQAALAYGVKFITNHKLLSINVDKYGAIESVVTNHDKQEHNIDAKTILIATGTNHHTQPLKDIDKKYHDQISLLGDMDPQYHGSVVKALASSKNLYTQIHTKLLSDTSVTNIDIALNNFNATVVDNKNITKNIHALTIHAPIAAKHAKTGQFFKIQLFDAQSKGYISEPIALSPTHINQETGCITFNIYIAGASTKICSTLKKGDPISLMGPTGSALQLTDEATLLVGENHLNEILQQISNASRCNNFSHLAFYDKGLQQKSHIEKIVDIENFKQELTLQLTHHKFTHLVLALTPKKLEIAKDIIATLRINNIRCDALVLSPMQCMMQGQCGRCLQVTKNEGQIRPIFTCRQQYLPVQSIDINILRGRLSHNNLLEKITNHSLIH